MHFRLAIVGTQEVQITIPNGFAYDFTVNWGDGTQNSYTGPALSHTYYAGTPATDWDVHICGTMSALNGFVPASVLRHVLDLGNTGLQNLNNAFQDCKYLNNYLLKFLEETLFCLTEPRRDEVQRQLYESENKVLVSNLYLVAMYQA